MKGGDRPGSSDECLARCSNVLKHTQGPWLGWLKVDLHGSDWEMK